MNEEQMIAQAESLGYFLTFDEGKAKYIMPIDRQMYTPEIFGGREMFGEVAPWTIQTTAYGPLASSEIDKVIQGYMRAQLMVSYLQAWGF